MLDDLELQQVQTIEVDGDQVWVQHGIPALEGDFLQGLGRRASQVTLTGVLTGAEVADSLKKLRDKFRAAAPATFVADIATAVRLEQVLIEEMGVRELAGRPARFEYAFTLREFTPATPTEIIIPPPPPPPPPPPVLESTLEVQVIVEGDPNFDHAQTRVVVEGRDESGQTVRRELPNDDPAVRQGNLWTVNPFPAGTYTATATTTSPAMSGSAPVALPLGQTQRAVIILRQGQAIATGFMIHYTFDRAFVEPCMRSVLRQVADFAAAHSDQRIIIVGHTDESGDPNYNQSLSERRARGAHAFLTFGRAPAAADAAVAEWNELRRTRPVGQTPSVRDSWGTREYQHMLQDLGFYNGQVHGTHDDATDQAVRDFQGANGLNVDGVVGDATWPVLIRAYMAQDPLSVPETQFMPNADPADGCDHGFVRWLGCGERMTASSPRPPLCTGPDPAWRPNRRTELLFVRAAAFPCDIAQPVTFNLEPPGGSGWCLGPGDPDARCCFLTRNANEQQKFLVQPAEPGTFLVNGRIQFEDGTPLANTEYVLIAPDGEFMNGEVTCAQQNGPRKGTPVLGRTDANGNFTDSAGRVGYPDIPKGPGVYTLAIAADVVARNQGEPIEAAKGPNVCARLDSNRNTLVAIVVGRAVVNVRPTIAPAGNVVVVRKPHTNPQRRAVTLSVNQAFAGSGAFTRSNDAIRFFDAAVGGNEITFNGVDNVFTDAQLVAGHTVFAEGARASAAVDDVELRLVLTVNGTPGLGATARMTSLELTLDICQSRTAPGVDPAPLSAADKINPGRPLQTPNLANTQQRALIIVRQAQPAAFVGDLVLTPLNANVQLFGAADEVPAVGQVPLAGPQVLANGGIPAGGARFWAQGATASAAARDTGFQLGLQGVEPDGDRVAITVIQLDVVAAAAANDPATTFVRIGLWDNAFDPATGNLRNNAAEAQNFIGSDTRHFFFRLRDPSRAGTATVRWRTLFANDANDDPRTPAGNQDLTVTETAAGSGVFLSRAVMLVTDDVDRAQATDSGLTAGDVGLRNQGQSNHRLRCVTVDDAHPLDGKVEADYAPLGVGIRPFTAPTLLFQRTPEERRRITIHLVNVRDRVGGTGVLDDAVRQARRTFQSIYAICGIFAEVDIFEIDPPASCTGWSTRYPTDPQAVNDPAVPGFTFNAANLLVPSAPQSDIINVVRARPGFNANHIYIVYVARVFSQIPTPIPPPPGPGLRLGGGEAFVDSFTPAGSIARGFGFVGVRAVGVLADVHEATHLTTNLRNAAGGHFDLGLPSPAPGPGNIDGKNLMQRHVLIQATGVANSKRLWNAVIRNNNYAPPLDNPAQIDAIRASRFVRPF
jgi:outer membrane protein OmpA-like peptidoglycan-associated protein